MSFSIHITSSNHGRLSIWTARLYEREGI